MYILLCLLDCHVLKNLDQGKRKHYRDWETGSRSFHLYPCHRGYWKMKRVEAFLLVNHLGFWDCYAGERQP